MNKLEIAPAARRDLTRLSRRASNQDYERLWQAIMSLTAEPRPYGIKKIKRFDEGYRIRVGNYRILYKIYDKAEKVVVSRVLRRSETTYRA